MDRPGAVRAAVAAGVILVFVALVGPSLLSTRPPGPSPTSPAATLTGASPRATSPAPTLDAWTDLEVPPYAAVADLVPSDVDRLGVATTSTFTLASRTGTPAADLARGLVVSPAVDFAIEPGRDPSQALIRPSAALEPGRRYRWDLTATDGSLAGTWLFTARQPLHVVGSLPGDQATGVPLNTGIEVTFDQDGATGVADHLSIEPAIHGRFEQHGRTWAFVPDLLLAPATVYTVTVRAGIGVAGSSERLETDAVIRFETAAKGTTRTRLEFERPILEVRPNTEPDTTILVVEDDPDQESPSPTSVAVDVYRLPSVAAAADAATRLTGDLAWAIAAPEATVATGGLERVARVNAEIMEWDSGWLLHVPARLPQGWYILSIDQVGGPAQLLLQVTDLAAYALVTTQSTVVWVNDLAREAPLGGATVELLGGHVLGTTRANGTLTVATPERLLTRTEDDGPSTAADLLAVRTSGGRALLVPLGLRWSWAYDAALGRYGGSDSDYWTLFRTDRYAYRQTDTVHITGLLLRRSDRTPPSDVRVQILPAEGYTPEATAGVAIATIPVSPSPRGAFIADVPIEDLPRSQYRLELLVGDETVATLHIRVTEIRKPAFEIRVDTERDVYLAGEEVRAAATAAFYDGTVVPGLSLRFGGFEDQATGTTDAVGHASATLTAGFSDEEVADGWRSEDVYVSPARPEEGDVSGTASIVVFPSRVWATGGARIDAGRIVVEGRLLWPDLAAFAAALRDDDGATEPTGPALEGGTASIRIVRHIVTRTQVGTRYDYIEKKVVPAYEETWRETTIGPFQVKSGDRGAFEASIDVPDPDGWYDVIVTVTDPEGRRLSREFDLTRPGDTAPLRMPYLIDGYSCGQLAALTVGLGDTATVTMHDGDGSTARGGRFLYVVSRQGVVDVVVQDEATFRRAMRDADLPSFTILGVWLSDDGFASSSALARIDSRDKRISVRLQADAPRYRPGDLVTVEVTTIGPGGRPIAADVVLQGVDEKLYAIGAAEVADPLPELLAPISSGFVQAYSSHATPTSGGDGCGDAGGEREDFVDAITFQRIETGADGRGEASFRLSDDLTSWRLTATALAAGLAAGQGSVLVPVGLPFFVEAVLAPDYLAGDAPVLRVRGYGDGVGADDAVAFRVTSPSLGVDQTVTARAFEAARVALPVLPVGDHDIRIEARATHDGNRLADTLVRRIHVVPSRLTALAHSQELLGPSFTPAGGDGLTTYLVTDAGRGSLIELLEELAASSSARYDRAAAAAGARRILIEEFGLDPATLPAQPFDGGRYEHWDGIALLPYGSADLALTSLAALTEPSRPYAGALVPQLLEIASADDTTRERSIIALAGAAGLGADVAAELGKFAPADLSIRERLWLALGLAATGDHAAARAIERQLLEEHGRRLGSWVRLDAGSTLEGTLEGSALLLVLAARLGDALAADVARYLVDNPSTERAIALELLAYADASLAWMPRSSGRFAYTVDGSRHEVTLEPGGAFSLVLTPAQRSTLRLEALEGRLAVVTSWNRSEPDLPTDPAISVTRTVTPAAGAPETGIVRVRLDVTFGAKVPAGCYQLTDLLPSGLAPLARAGGPDEEEGSFVVWPYEVDGQRVSWCVDPQDPQRTFGYSARVVSPGTYRWEPAVIQSVVAPTLGSSTQPTTYAIR